MSTRDDEIRIVVSGSGLDATLVSPVAASPGVLFVHGWGGSRQQYLARAREIASIGCICLTFDLRGHARSEEMKAQVSREDNLADVLAAFDYLCARPDVEDDAIAVVGSSYGGYLAAILTEMRPVRWLALRAPALYQDVGWLTPKLQLHKDQDLPTYRRRHLAAGENRALRACAAFRGEVLLIESGHDAIIPHAVVQSYREACAQARSLTVRTIAEADHGLTDPIWQRAYTRQLANWLGGVALAARGRQGTPPDIAGEPESAPEVLNK